MTMKTSRHSKAFLIGWPLIGSLYLLIAIWDFADGHGFPVGGIVWSILAIAWAVVYYFELKKK